MKRRWIGGLLVLAFRLFAFGDTQTFVRMKAEVVVQGTVVQLSDLLTANAPRAIRDASSGIELGSAPKVGTIRVLDREQILTRLASVPWLCSQLMIPERVTIESRGWPVTKTKVRDALSAFMDARGLAGIAESHLEIPAIAASIPDPDLRVVGIHRSLQEQAFQAHMRCFTRDACGDFLVNVTLPDGHLPLFHLRVPENDAQPALLVRKGEHASLALSGSNMKISMPVVCLESGALNQRVHVLDKRNQKVYFAEVLGKHLVHASL